jgi:hypothetical protein
MNHASKTMLAAATVARGCVFVLKHPIECIVSGFEAALRSHERRIEVFAV